MAKRGQSVGSVGKRKATKFTGVYLSPKSGKFIIKFKCPKSGRYRELVLDGVTDPEEAALIRKKSAMGGVSEVVGADHRVHLDRRHRPDYHQQRTISCISGLVYHLYRV